MQIRSQVTKTVKDYSNPKKHNKFSPSPIKRYQSSKSFNVPTSTDNKENMGILSQQQQWQNNQQLHKSNGDSRRKNFKKPLTLLFNKMSVNQNSDSMMMAQNSFPLEMETQKDLGRIEKSKSETQRPLEFIEDNQQHLLNRDLFTKIEKTLAQKKRMEKLERKLNHQDPQKPTSAQITEINDDYMPPAREVQEGVREDIQGSSRKEQLSQQNKKSDKESDSLMEGSYQSNASGAAGSMQYQGRWTQEEHDKFIEGLNMFGKDWRQIEDYIGSRTCAQIRSHAQKYFNKLNRELSRSSGKYEKGPNKRRKIEDSKKDYIEVPLVQESIPQKISQHSLTEAFQLPPAPVGAQASVGSGFNLSQSQIHETLQKLAEDDTLFTLQEMITKREEVCFEFMTKKMGAEDACKSLITITNAFHQQAMKALQSCKFEICNRMVDERNLTQFICILLSKQVTVLPLPSSTQSGTGSGSAGNTQEILQHVHTSISHESLPQQSLDLAQLGSNYQGVGEMHERETAKSSPKELIKSSSKKDQLQKTADKSETNKSK